MAAHYNHRFGCSAAGGYGGNRPHGVEFFDFAIQRSFIIINFLFMNDTQWEDLVERIKDKFENFSVKNESWEVAYGEERHGASVDTLEFSHPSAGSFKVVRENTPLVLDKKHHYSHRQGDTARTEYVLSDTEQSHKLKVYRDDGGDWEEVSASDLKF